jgi:type I restriction enzyme S subunit
MGSTSFRDWFVDFGPTRAKVDGRPAYLAAVLWALFPNRLDEDDKPETWSIRRVDELLELAYGKALPASSREAGEFPVYGSGGIAGYHNDALVAGPSIIVGRKGTVGSVYWEDRNCFPSDTVFYVIAKNAPLLFCFYLLQSLGLETMNTDAAVPGLNRNNVYRLNVALGHLELLQHFNDLVSPLRRRMSAAYEESQTLGQTRDLLLPKLMSGEVRFRDAEKKVAELV